MEREVCGMSIEWTPQAHRVVEARPYTGRSVNLDANDLLFFQNKYQLEHETATRFISVDPDSNRYILPFYSPTWAARGHILRLPWGGAPRTPVADYMKADTFKISPADPLLAWYRGGYRSNREKEAVLVEDQLSAIKLLQHDIVAIACLGKPVSTKYSSDGNGRVQELARHAPNLIVALDADATADAFMFVRQWGPAFRSIRVAILTRDLKDERASDFGRILGL